MALVASALVLAVAWQSARYQELSSRAKALESAQEAKIEENRKLESGIAVLSSRTRTGEMVPSLGLEMAEPEDRMRVLVGPGEGFGG